MSKTTDSKTINSLTNVPAAACPRCGGWTPSGGMSQHSRSAKPVQGRTGCTCFTLGAVLVKDSQTHGVLVANGVRVEIDTAAGRSTNDRDVMTQANREVERLGLFVEEWIGADEPAGERKTIYRNGTWTSRLVTKPALFD